MDYEGVLISCDADSADYAESELKRLFSALPTLQRISSAEQMLLVADPGIPFVEFAGKIATADPLIAPVFIRHLAPVQAAVHITPDEAGVEVVVAKAIELAHTFLDPTRTFSAQTRRTETDETTPADGIPVATLNRAIAAAVGEATGATLDFRNPEQVVSVFCHEDTVLIGISETVLNRSAWPGGQHRFRKESGQISRAEFKILEALSVFSIALPEKGRALDIGAAPGGWTRILRQQGLTVVAVDPADLHPSLARDRGITHIRQRIQRYTPDQPFDVIVNDMKMDAPESIAIVRQLRPSLITGGTVIMTLKLPQNVRPASRMLGFVQADLETLSESYTLVGARQLFHNRSEITVVLEG